MEQNSESGGQAQGAWGGGEAEGFHQDSHPSRKEMAETAVRGLLQRFAVAGTFGNVTEVVGGMEDRFTLRDYLRMFRSVPRLRKDLLAGLAWNLIKPRAKNAAGYGLRHTPGGKYTFFHRSFCDLVVWESILAAVRHFGLEPGEELRASALGSVEMALRNGREIDFAGSPLTVFSYYPSRDHLVPPGHPAYKHFLSWDAGVPDNDSTCIVLGSLMRMLLELGEPMDGLGRPDAVMSRHLRLLKAHLHKEGTYGQGFLSYESGVTDRDRGVLTWIFDAHNELDPTSNINILNFLFLLPAAGYRKLEPEIAFLTRRILGFLRNHARDGSFFHPRLQQYYPSGSTCFFWHRFLRTVEASDPEAVRALDPEGSIAEVNAFMEAEARGLFRDGTAANRGDEALAAPFLVRQGILPGSLSRLSDPAGTLAHFAENAYEIFHLLYPVQVICVTESMPLAAYLAYLVEWDKKE